MFRTHIVISNETVEKIGDLLNSLPVKLKFLNDPSYQFFESKDYRGRSMIIRRSDNIDEDHSTNEDIYQQEILIDTEDPIVAENFQSLLIGIRILLESEINDHEIPGEICEYPPDMDPKLLRDPVFAHKFKFLDRSIVIFRILAEIFTHQKLIYAIEKYHISISLNAPSVFSMSPKYGKVFDEEKYSDNYYVSGAFAINAAYSVIEELGLDIRSSREKPRFTKKEEGIWNPEVLLDIEARLEEIGITQTDKIDWLIRGVPSELDDDLKPRFGKPSAWNSYEDVNDLSLSFPEAIHYASYLRNFITAHKLRTLSAKLSPYLIFNVQFLARRLILQKIDYWNKI